MQQLDGGASIIIITIATNCPAIKTHTPVDVDVVVVIVVVVIVVFGAG